MKRTLLFLLTVTLSLILKAEDAVGTRYTVRVCASAGTFCRHTTQTGQTWNNLWTASEAPVLKLSTPSNNMTKSTDSDISIYSGSAKSSHYTLSVSGNYRITGYTFKGTAGAGSQTFTPGGRAAVTFSSGSAVDISVDGLHTRSTSFSLNGDNVGIRGELTVSIVKAAFAPDLTVKQGYQATGRGATAVLLCAVARGDAHTPYTLNSLTMDLKGNSALLSDSLSLFITRTNEFFADTTLRPLAVKAPADGLTFVFSPVKIDTTGKYYLWLTSAVKASAAYGDTLDAALRSVGYVYEGKQYTDTLNADPEGVAKIFGSQSFPFVPTTYNSRFYRIPAMIVAADSSIVVACDKRYASNADLGDHKIDVVCRRSTDNGKTWSAPQIIASGDGSSEDKYGYGDPALARASNGDLICVFAAAKNIYWDGITHIGITISRDNGKTWSTVRDLTAARFTDEISGTRNKFGERSIFVSSGRGITTKEGEIMFLANVLSSSDNIIGNYILKSADNGQSWTLCKEEVYHGGDESKLACRPDGNLLASIRQSGARGFNIGSPSGRKWLGQHRSTTISGNACNADILSYSDKLMLHSIISNVSSRRDLRLFASSNQGDTWVEVERIQDGYAAYSTLEKLPSGDVALLYEDASYGDNGYAINFITIPAEVVEKYSGSPSGQ